jgi:hypothetical protein
MISKKREHRRVVASRRKASSPAAVTTSVKECRAAATRWRAAGRAGIHPQLKEGRIRRMRQTLPMWTKMRKMMMQVGGGLEE